QLSGHVSTRRPTIRAYPAAAFPLSVKCPPSQRLSVSVRNHATATRILSLSKQPSAFRRLRGAV
ncbi:hypothetical protein, partial [Mycobacterium sp. SP-6446]|uniref:hypothetical protein n=1 Tax=Mycobacterium sp. SP-6446 TaxID=1834162 RepID=UPI001C377541